MSTVIKEIKPGIKKLTNNDGDYVFWTNNKIVRKYIRQRLEKMYPNSIVMDEINDIDMVVIGENLAVEIQASKVSKISVSCSSFEKDIEKQIKENIENNGTCIFFFDSEFFRYLQSPDIHRKISINMDWFRKYMKQNVLRVFTVRHDGIITEVYYKDFDFLSNISMTCKIAYDSDIRVLNRNKFKILDRLLKGKNFTQNEINRYRDEYERDKERGYKSYIHFLYKHDKRAREFAAILHVVGGYLEDINNILDLNVDEFDRRHQLFYLSVLGLIEVDNKSVNSMGRHIDKYNVGELMPGYVRRKETWDKLKEKWIRLDRLESIIMKKYDITKGIDFYWQ